MSTLKAVNPKGEKAVDREELAWAAGFFDGEGTASYERSGQYGQLRLQVGQKDRRPLDRFCAAVGVGRIYTSNKRDIFRWHTNRSADAIAAIGFLWTWLDQPKREQVRSAMSTFGKSAFAGTRHSDRCTKGHVHTTENTYITKAGYSACRWCKNEWRAEYRRIHGRPNG